MGTEEKNQGVFQRG